MPQEPLWDGSRCLEQNFTPRAGDYNCSIVKTPIITTSQPVFSSPLQKDSLRREFEGIFYMSLSAFHLSQLQNHSHQADFNLMPCM